MTSRELLALAVIGAPAATAIVLAVVPRRLVGHVANLGAALSALAAGGLAVVALAAPGSPLVERWLVVDAAAAIFVAVIGTVGLASVVASASYLSSQTGSLVRAEHRTRVYYGLLFAFWAILAAVPVVGNLAGAWLLIEATTAASALLVGFSGRPRALEAGWKYLILTSLGLGVALLGIVALAARSTAGGLDALSWRELSAVQPGHATVVAYLLVLAGLASKIGWAPVHNWLPDAHSEAPAPVSALLSAALLPTVLLVAWRSSQALEPVLGRSTTHGVLVAFGLVSLAVAVPFLWRPLPWKRLLAYSSLEHMGVIALGIGFGTPLALAGVAVHIAGHAVAKATGFYAATPLLSLDPRAGVRASRGVVRTQPGLGSVLGGEPRRARRAAAFTSLRERGDDRRRWVCGRPAVDGCGGSGAPGVRLPRPRARADRDHRGQRSEARCAAPGRSAGRARARCRRGCPAPRTHRGCGAPAGQRDRARTRSRCRVSDYRTRIAVALESGSRFAGLHASGAGVHTALVSPDGTIRFESAQVVDGHVTSIVDLVPAANWDEREASDLHGVVFDGHEPLRPLVDHDLDLSAWTVPVHGHDAYQVAVGPIHAGVIESGHFRFHVVGDRILHLDARLFYKHRGLEPAAAGRTFAEGLAYAGRACAACSVANTVAYAQACEEIMGLQPTAEVARARTILLELERLWNHLNDIGQVCAGVGLAAGSMRFASLTERARRLNARLTGHRFMFGAVEVGGSRVTFEAAEVRDDLAALRTESEGAWRELLFNASFSNRLPDVGIVSREAAATLGAVGPAARASGLAEDARTTSKTLAYDGLTAIVPHRAAGDVQARLEQRALEVQQTFDVLASLLGAPVVASSCERTGVGRAIGAARVESPRGATLCVVESAGGRVDRLRLRTGSYANWPVVAHAAAGNLLPDFPLINKSFELCYACADR